MPSPHWGSRPAWNGVVQSLAASSLGVTTAWTGRDGRGCRVVRLSGSEARVRVGCCDRSCLLAPGGMSKPESNAGSHCRLPEDIVCSIARKVESPRGGAPSLPFVLKWPGLEVGGRLAKNHRARACFRAGPTLIPAACFENNDPVIVLPPSLDFSPSLPTTEQRPTSRDPASPRTSAPFRRAPRDRQSPRRRDELPRRERTRSPGSNT